MMYGIVCEKRRTPLTKALFFMAKVSVNLTPSESFHEGIESAT